MDTPLTRTSDDQLLTGVCGGIARRLNVNSNVVRAAFIGGLVTGLSPLAYVVCWIAMPKDEWVTRSASQPEQPTVERMSPAYQGQQVES